MLKSNLNIFLCMELLEEIPIIASPFLAENGQRMK